MGKKKDIRPKDSKGELHGYHEWYYINGNPYFRGFYKHGLEIGYEELHMSKTTRFNIR